MRNIKKYLEDLLGEYVKLVDKHFWKLMDNQDKKCTCERPDDNTCDYCDEKQSIEILKEAKERHNSQEKVEQAAKKYHGDNQFKSNHPHCPYSFIDGAKWQAERYMEQEELENDYQIDIMASTYREDFYLLDEEMKKFIRLKMKKLLKKEYIRLKKYT
jgi:hypothetical protein